MLGHRQIVSVAFCSREAALRGELGIILLTQDPVEEGQNELLLECLRASFYCGAGISIASRDNHEATKCA